MEEKKFYFLTPSQSALIQVAEGAQTLEVLSLITSVEFRSQMDEKLLESAIYETAKRLPYCNVRLRHLEDGTIAQYMCRLDPEPVEIVNFSPADQEEEEEQFREWNSDAFPPDFDDLQLYQFKILRYPDGHHGLFFCLQHFIMDAYAASYTLQYLCQVYVALKNGTELPPRGPEPWPFVEKDQQYFGSPRYRKSFEKLLSYFDTEPRFTSLNGIDSPEFIPEKRYGKNLDFTQLFNILVRYPLAQSFTEEIEQSARKRNLSAQIFYLLALRCYLGEVCRTNDVTLGSLVCCRSTLLEKRSGFNVAQGQFVRTQLDENSSFEDALSETAELQNEMLRHSKVVGMDVQRAYEDRYHVPEGCTYTSTWVTYFPPLSLMEDELDFTAKFTSNNWAAIPLYWLILPDSNHKTLTANYWYSEAYIARESIDRFHSFMLKFLENGIHSPDCSLKELTRVSLK